MAETVGILILSAAGAGEVAGIAGLGTLAGTTVAGVSLATVVGTAAIIGATIGLSYALKPDLPTPEAGSQALKQAVPPRIRGYGINRLAGYYMLFDAGGNPPNRSFDVLAVHAGRIGSFDQFIFSDDTVLTSTDISHGGNAVVVSPYSDGRYGSGTCQLETRLGLPDQIALQSFYLDPLINSVWTTAHRGRGIAHVGLKCDAMPNPSDFTQVFPRGRPELSVIAHCSPVWDPRDPAQNRFDEATWQVSTNPVIQLIDYLTRADGGMGLDLDIILPPERLAEWMVEADLCDELVPMTGGAEKRYTSNGWFRFDNNPEDVLGSLLATCDGWLAEAGDGTLSLTIGFYREPTEPPLTEKHISGFALNYGQADEQLVNQLDITFTDPTQKYVPVQTEPWQDTESIAEAGIIRQQPLTLTWVHSNSQARRLADRAMQRLNALMTGSFTTSLYGLRYLGQRWVALQYPFVSGLQDCIVEIQGAEINLAEGEIKFDFIRILPDYIEAYDPDQDEGTAPPVPPSNAATAMIREDGSFYYREDGTTNIIRETN